MQCNKTLLCQPKIDSMHLKVRLNVLTRTRHFESLGSQGKQGSLQVHINAEHGITKNLFLKHDGCFVL